MLKTHSALLNFAFFHGFPVALPLLWAGVSLGGNLVAAPAKFQVAALEMPVALQVGRAQFTWIAYIEWAIPAAVLAASLIQLKRPSPVFLPWSSFPCSSNSGCSWYYRRTVTLQSPARLRAKVTCT